MRSLFLKIFLSFWLTVVLIGVSIALIWSRTPEMLASRWRAFTAASIGMYAQAAADTFDRSGASGLQDTLARIASTAHIQAHLLDNRGMPVTGESISDAERQIALAAGSTSESQFDMLPHNTVAAQRVTGPSGHVYVFVAEMPRPPFGRLRPNARTELLRAIVALLISGLICYWLARYLTSPILRLRGAATNLGAGDLSARAGGDMDRRRDEIGELVRDFNRMADRIETLVTSQRQLISDISHELRSPLARLNVALGLARQRTGAEAAPLLDRIEREAERLNEMIGRLLTLARLQSAAEPPEKERVGMRALLEDVKEDAEFEAAARNCKVQLQAKSDCAVIGNKELLRSAIENVVRNAIRYTAAGGDIEIALSCTPVEKFAVRALVAIRDHGPGLPDRELDKIFRPFYRATGARERETGGTGLGLAITERAVRLHGGSVRAINALGGGLEVQITLPATLG